MAFNNKNKNMPSIQNMTTEQLLASLQQYVLGIGMPYLNELNNRVVKSGDSDDTATIINGTPMMRGGIRPHSAPLVP